MDTAARARLDRWKLSLLDHDSLRADPADRLLDLADHGVPIGLDPVRIAFALAAGGSTGFALEAAPEPAMAQGLLRVALDGSELERRMTLLRRAARAATADGDHVLWLALGLLSWTDGEGGSRLAPLVLWPVEIESSAPHFRLVAAAGMRPRVNEFLLEGLRREHDFSIDISDDFDLAALLDRITGFALTQEGWHVELTCRLATLSFARFDLWRDLESLGDSASGPLAWLTGSEDAAPSHLPAAQSDLLAPLDADASQLAAISAAGAGGSFILQGAPGTGKSQTIANLVVHCAAQGKSVLVVSDRTSALDVIGQRLALAGLPELCLPLHAANGNRTQVLGAMMRVLERTFRPGSGPSVQDARMTELRGALDGYASALHKVRPLGMSVHDVLGRLVELRTTPRAALAERDAAALNRATFLGRRAAIEALAAAALPVEPVLNHPWRTSALEAWSTEGTERATRALNDLASASETLASALADVGAMVPGLVAKTPDQLRAIGALADLAAASPRPGAELLTNMRGARNDETGERIALIRARGGGTVEVPRDPAAFLAIATRHRLLAREVDEVFTDSINDLDDPSELWTQLKRWTSSMAAFRYVALRNARAALRAASQPTQLESDGAMLAGLEAVIAERACRAALLGAAEPARRWFGDLGGTDPLALDLEKIEEAVAWGAELRRAFDQVALTGGESARQAAWRALVAQVSASPATGERPAVELAPFARLAAAVARWEPAIAEVSAATGIAKNLLGASNDHLAALRDQVDALRQAVGSLGEWTLFHLARRAAIVAGVGPAVTAIERGDLGAAELAGAWERANLLAWVELEIAETPALAEFHGGSHHAHVSAFADLDRGSLALIRARAVARIAERQPRARDGNVEVAILRDEAGKAQGRSLRAVLADLPTLLPRVAPCVLATPHAIAQHLSPSLPAFDVVVFDEASRLPLAHALGALARGKAIVVAGDDQQPSVPDSLFDTARAARLPTIALTAHYRSRHEDVFAFANSRYYGDRLEVLPAPSGSPDLGISWRRVEGSPDAAGANRSEADAIVADLRARLADAVQRTRSYAVVTLSRAQQELIEDLLGDAPGVLVGTPDQLQGEEADVAFLSVGDSADALGALSHPGAQRWLNVAITRAREQLVVVASFDPEAIAGDVAPGARQLAELLAFARAGGGASKPAMDTPPASPITAAIARALTERGWQLAHNIGCGPYRVDLAVVDPNDPERYVLAIEHDGSTYASSTNTRSRDRLRGALMTQLGWRLHRVWSLDWWLDPEREIQRAHGAIVAAVAASRQRRALGQAASAPAQKPLLFQRRARGTSAPVRATGSAPVVNAGSTELGDQTEQVALETTARLAVPELDRLRGASLPGVDDGWALLDETRPVGARAAALAGESAPALAAGSGPTDAVSALPSDLASAPIRLPRGAIAIGPYTAAAVPAGRRAPDDMFAQRYVGELGKCVEQVLAAEAPIHLDVLARRCAAYFGIGRITQRVVDQIKTALDGRGKLGPEQNIVWRNDQDPTSVPGVRVAGQSASARREITEVPLSEVAAAARIVVERANGMSATDLVRDCARLLGFARITEKVTERVALGVRLAAARELISIDGGKAHLLLDG